MGVAERREREKQQRRSDILDAAEKVFFTKGIKDATMDEIAEVAELSKGTLYLYFPSREDLYYGINLRALGMLREMFEEAVRSGRTGIDKVRAVGQAYYEFSQRYPNHFEAMLHFDAHVVEPEKLGGLALECHRAGMEVLRMLADAIGQGIKDESIRPDLDPMRTAILLWAQTDGVIRVIARKCEHMKEFENLDLKDLISDFFAFALKALTPARQQSGGTDQAGNPEGSER